MRTRLKITIRYYISFYFSSIIKNFWAQKITFFTSNIHSSPSPPPATPVCNLYFSHTLTTCTVWQTIPDTRNLTLKFLPIRTSIQVLFKHMHVMPNLLPKQTAGFLKACKYLCTASLHSHFSSNIWRMQDTCSTVEINTDDPQQFRLHTGMFICKKPTTTTLQYLWFQAKRARLCQLAVPCDGDAPEPKLYTALRSVRHTHTTASCNQRTSRKRQFCKPIWGI